MDFFLGNSFDYTKIDPRNPAFSTYLNRSFNKDHLLKKTWDVWIEDRLGNPSNGRLLDYIIQRGKKLYTLTKLLPEIQDSVLFEFTPKQLEWCNKNKVEIWSYFLAENLLYSTELLKFNKLVNPSPNSPGMPPEAPGQTGSYIASTSTSAASALLWKQDRSEPPDLANFVKRALISSNVTRP